MIAQAYLVLKAIDVKATLVYFYTAIAGYGTQMRVEWLWGLKNISKPDKTAST